MRFLTLAERELRAGARRPATYYVRWMTAVAFFGLLLWLLWAFDADRNPRASRDIFRVFSVLIFIYTLIVGTARTADSLSGERRDGTLGLLYLTNLNSAEILAGKLCSSALTAIYGLVAIFPILALLLLMGGISIDYFWLTVLALSNAILFSLAAGLFASAFCVRQFMAVGMAIGLALLVNGALIIAAAIIHENKGPAWCVEWLAAFCPLYLLLTADGTRLFGAGIFWPALGANVGMAMVLLVLAGWGMARGWRDRPRGARRQSGWIFWRRRNDRPALRDQSQRRRSLNLNPFYWLAGRARVSSPIFMLLTVLLVLVTTQITVPFFGRLFRNEDSGVMIGCLFAWLWTGLAFFGLSFYYAAAVASQPLAEDRQSGALEMILCTPTNERVISRGLWLAYLRRMFFPGLVCLLVHAFFLWQCMIMCVLEPPGSGLRNATPGEYFWAATLNQPVRGQTLDWEFVFLIRIAILILPMSVLVWYTLGWVGRWLGLKMKHPGFAPFVSLGLVFIPPIIGFSAFCYLADKLNWDRLPERRFLPIMLYVALGIAVVHCTALCSWAAGRLSHDFRTTVTSRLQPPSRWRWWRPGWRAIGAFARRLLILVLLVALFVGAFYGYQNWRAGREWRAFQAELRQKGRSLKLETSLPSLPVNQPNFAQHPDFVKLKFGSRTGDNSVIPVPGANLFDQAYHRYGMISKLGLDWMEQKPAQLSDYLTWLEPRSSSTRQKSPDKAAGEILRQLETHGPVLRNLAEAARDAGLKLGGSPEARVVLQESPEAQKLERLHFVYVMRGTARLAEGQTASASEDVLTSLRLAQLARQLPDVKSSQRVQILALRSFQPLWEGMSNHQWDGSQLAALQEELSRFDLLSDHTNTVHRVALAYIEVWSSIADNPEVPKTVPNLSGGSMYVGGWRWQPRAWWRDRCIQIYRAGEKSIQRVDVASQKVRIETDWQALQGLNLSQEAEQLFENYYWGQRNPTMISYAQTALNQAVLACALERYRLAEGNYPERLSALSPRFLDRALNDVVSGREMGYERKADGGYVLWGVGNDQRDNQHAKGSDDWIWELPTNSATSEVDLR